MSNTKAWRAKKRTAKPNARMKRNGLFLDAHPNCQHCTAKPAQEAHHELPRGNPDRYEWQFMKALCSQCHIDEHQRLAPASQANSVV